MASAALPSDARRFEAAAADGVGREEVVPIRGQLRRRKVTRSVGGLAAAVGVLRSAAEGQTIATLLPAVTLACPPYAYRNDIKTVGGLRGRREGERRTMEGQEAGGCCYLIRERE